MTHACPMKLAVKAAKLLAGDLGAQAAAADVLRTVDLIADAARTAGVASPLLDVCHALLAERDMIGVLAALEARTAGVTGAAAAAPAPPAPRPAP